MRGVPAAITGFPMLFTLMAVSLLGYSGAAAMSVLLFISAAAVFVYRMIKSRAENTGLRPAVAVILLFCALTSLSFSVRERIYFRAAEELDGKTAYVTGTVVDIPPDSGGHCSVVRTDGKKRYRFLLDHGDGVNEEIGDRFSGRVTFTANGSVMHGTAVKALLCDPDGNFTHTGRTSFAGFFQSVRRRAGSCVDKFADGDEAAFIKGVLTGDDSQMSYFTGNDFRFAGLSHMIVISGAHLSIVVSLILTLSPTGKRRRNFAFVSILLMLAYMFIAGMGSSVVRAGICAAVYISSAIFGRDSDPLNSLGVCAVLTCLISPHTALSVGFQLSFFAVCGIVVIAVPVINNMRMPRVNRCVRRMIWAVIISASVELMLLPLTLIYFSNITTVAILSNAVFCWVIGAMIVIGVLLVITSFSVLLAPINYLAGMLISLIAKLCISGVGLFARIPYSCVKVPGTQIMLCICIALVPLGFLLFAKDRRLRKLCIVTVCSVTVLAASLCAADLLRVTVSSVSDRCTVISCRGTVAVIGCCTDEYELNGLSGAILSVSENKADILIASGDGVEPTKARISPEITVTDMSGTAVSCGNIRAAAYEDYTLLVVGGMKLAVADKGADLSEAGRLDYIICRGDCIGDAENWIMYPGTEALAIGAEKVYNVESKSFTLRIGSFFGTDY